MIPMKGFIDDNLPSGTVQPDTAMAVMGTPFSDPIDPSSGLFVETIVSGTFPNPLGDTTPIPHPLAIADIPGSKNDVG